MQGLKKFQIRFSGEFQMSELEIWPDGDAPENPTTRDVIKRMREVGKIGLLEDWNLLEDLEISVDGKDIF